MLLIAFIDDMYVELVEGNSKRSIFSLMTSCTCCINYFVLYIFPRHTVSSRKSFHADRQFIQIRCGAPAYHFMIKTVDTSRQRAMQSDFSILVLVIFYLHYDIFHSSPTDHIDIIMIIIIIIIINIPYSI